MKNKLIIISTLLLMLGFPVVAGLIIMFSTYVLKFLNILPIVYIDNPFEMTIGEYSNIIISLLSCFSSAIIAFLAFKLSKTIENRNQFQEINKKKAILEILICQMKYDKKIIETYCKKIGNDLEFLVLLDLTHLLEVRDMFDKDTLMQILDVSTFINSLKYNNSTEFQNVTNSNNYLQNIDKTISKIEKIIEEMK